MKEISIDSIMSRVRTKIKGNFDFVVAIGRGGILPGYLISRYLDIPLEIVYSEFRNDNHKPKYENPKVQINYNIQNMKNKKILLVDDISNSGKTILNVKERIKNNKITTVVIYGNADISLFGTHDECIKWPWE